MTELVQLRPRGVLLYDVASQESRASLPDEKESVQNKIKTVNGAGQTIGASRAFYKVAGLAELPVSTIDSLRS